MAEEEVTTTTTEETPATEAPAVEATTKRKKNKRTVLHGQVHVYATFNNTIITVTDNKGNKLTSSSAGACGFRGSKKGTAYAAQIASEKTVSEAKQNHGLKKADVFVKGTGLGRDAAIRSLQNADISVESITEMTPVAHGGVRPKRARRT
jgi:small subunit ribosomal protein S11